MLWKYKSKAHWLKVVIGFKYLFLILFSGNNCILTWAISYFQAAGNWEKLGAHSDIIIIHRVSIEIPLHVLECWHVMALINVRKTMERGIMNSTFVYGSKYNQILALNGARRYQCILNLHMFMANINGAATCVQAAVDCVGAHAASIAMGKKQLLICIWDHLVDMRECVREWLLHAWMCCGLELSRSNFKHTSTEVDSFRIRSPKSWRSPWLRLFVTVRD